MSDQVDFVRPAKAKWIRKYREDLECREDLRVENLANGTILPLVHFPEDALSFGRGGCVDDKSRYIGISGIEGRVFGGYDYSEDEVAYRDKRAIFCGFLVEHWGHFLIEAITRLWYVLEAGEEYDEFVFIIERGSDPVLYGNYRELLDLLGVMGKTTLVSEPTRYREIAIPEISYSRMRYWSRKYTQTFEAVCSAVRKNRCERFTGKVYLSRSRFSSLHGRTERGLDMLDDFFGKNGYQVLYPEEMSLGDLIVFLRQADVIASESGSCAHNLLFARKGAAIEIVERQGYVNEIQANIDKMMSFRTTYIDAYYALYPTNAADGPYLLMYNDYLKRFGLSRGYTPPSKRYLTEGYKRRSIRWYIRFYRKKYGYRIFFDDVVALYHDVFAEVMSETVRDFSYYLIPFGYDIKRLPNRIAYRIMGPNAYSKLKYKFIK